MTWELVVTKSAQKELRKLPQKDLDHVRAALIKMCNDPFSGDVVRLHAHPVGWRRRVGNYRIFFDLYPERRIVVVFGVRRRTSTTY